MSGKNIPAIKEHYRFRTFGKFNDAENAEFLASSRLWMVEYFCDSYSGFLKHSQVHVSTVHTV